MKKKPTIAISPVSHEYLTKGKEYKIEKISTSDRTFFFIKSDTGYELHCLFDECAHINFLSWTLK